MNCHCPLLLTSEVVNSTDGKLICRCPDVLQQSHSSTQHWQSRQQLARVAWTQQEMTLNRPARILVHSTRTGVLEYIHAPRCTS